jgi:hypothetical protein
MAMYHVVSSETLRRTREVRCFGIRNGAIGRVTERQTTKDARIIKNDDVRASNLTSSDA